ncbi:uncharacterized protein [Montipora capricornis]|uniref:uncharacterized protein n=1 Tax=Montipora capricornis TaxID=246305 RepID=UPI0035F1A5BC
MIGHGKFSVDKKVANLQLKIIFENQRRTTTKAPWWYPTTEPATTKSPKTATTSYWWLPTINQATTKNPTSEPVTNPSPSTSATGTPATTVPLTPSVPSQATRTSGAYTTFQIEGLNAHNLYRHRHKVPPMLLDRKVCDDAQRYAAELATKGLFQHAPNLNGMGENLSMGCMYGNRGQQSAQNTSKASYAWYNEVCSPGYNFEAPGNQAGTGHFTQVVWKTSTKLGIGKADANRPGGETCTYIVGRYEPGGNVLSYYGTNVLKGKFNKLIHCKGKNTNNPAGFADNNDEYIL